MRQCPFCGGSKLKIEQKRGSGKFQDEYVSALTASVRCNSCHARGPTVRVPFSQNPESPRYLPEHEAAARAEKLAEEKWDNRF